MFRTAVVRRMAVAVAIPLCVFVASATAEQRPSAGSARPSADALKLPFETYQLPNGLTVILATDRTTPTVAVNVWYKVGSKNEAVGRTGFAHLFEHVMFTGSGNVPYGLHDKLTEGVGGMNNGTTNNDRTNYYETVPSNYLESALWLEADRMGFLLDSLDLAKLNAQRDIVKNERRQGMDNQPYGRVSEILAKATYPSGHPYSWEVIGSMEDLSAASEEDVKNFFRLYYAPNNAYLAIVGDFDPAQTKAWVTKYFGDIPRGKPITRPKVAPATLSAEKRLVFEDRVQVPRLYMQWPTVGSRDDDRFALEVLASILTGARTARITKALVYDEQAAASAVMYQTTSEDVGDFVFYVTPRPGHTLTSLEAATDAIIERLKTEGPTAEEMQKAIAGEELGFLQSLQRNIDKSFRLADGAGYHGDAGYFRTEYQKTLAVTAAVVPPGKLTEAAKADQSTRVTDYDTKKPEGGK
jgi:zinc protease